jgi:hypothetical protein
MSAVSISTRYVFLASMDVTPEAEHLFNEVYDTEHVPNLLQVPGVRSVTRMKGEPARFAIAGAVRELPAPSPIYTAIYEIDDPQVLQSPQWAEAVECGRWPSEVRPHTSNRQHLLFKVVSRTELAEQRRAMCHWFARSHAVSAYGASATPGSLATKVAFQPTAVISH